MSDWVWADIEVASAAHDEQLAEHGGAAGLRDRSMLKARLPARSTSSRMNSLTLPIWLPAMPMASRVPIRSSMATSAPLWWSAKPSCSLTATN
jgi:hypothetical protein